MNAALVITVASAALGGAIACAVALRARHCLPRWSFAAGMALLAADSVSAAMAASASVPANILF